MHPGDSRQASRQRRAVSCSCFLNGEAQVGGSQLNTTHRGICQRTIELSVALVLLVPVAAGACKQEHRKLVLTPGSLQATTSPPFVYLGDSLAFHYRDEDLVEAVAQAIKLWSACSEYATGFPRFVDRGPADRILDVELLGSSLDGRCGSFSGRRIILYRFSRRSSGALLPCGSLGQNLAHEIGHSLGLDDRSRRRNGAASIMTILNPANPFSRAVQVEECRAVDLRWQTRAEMESPADSESLVPTGVGGSAEL